MTGNVSLVSSHAELRELIVAMQQEIARPGRIVMDGRDIGTVVMPDAQWKFFCGQQWKRGPAAPKTAG